MSSQKQSDSDAHEAGGKPLAASCRAPLEPGRFLERGGRWAGSTP
jgi:hypothetical protein